MPKRDTHVFPAICGAELGRMRREPPEPREWQPARGRHAGQPNFGSRWPSLPAPRSRRRRQGWRSGPRGRCSARSCPLLPAPGQCPSEKTRRTGFFRMQIHTGTSAGVRYLGTIVARGDPGYAATAVMLGETALCLALDRDQLPDRAGILTPATAMGAALATRLRSVGHTLATRLRSLSNRGIHPRSALLRAPRIATTTGMRPRTTPHRVSRDMRHERICGQRRKP